MKEFDIYLRNRVTECDIIISSLALHDELTVCDHMLLENCLEKCLLYKAIAAGTGSELGAHIDRTIKTCYEKLRLSASVEVSAEFTSRALVGCNDTEMVFGSSKLRSTKSTCEPIIDGTEITVDQLNGLATKYANIDMGVDIGAGIDSTLKTSFISFDTGLLAQADVTESVKKPAAPDCSVAEIGIEVRTILRRRRPLTEIDELDPMMSEGSTLASLDFIVLQD